MPSATYRRRRTRRSRRRRTGRRYRRSAGLRSVPVRRPIASLGALAPSATVLTLSTVATFHSASATMFNYRILGNNPNKPFAASNAQPRGFDQWYTMYKRAMVTSFRVIVKAVCARNTSAGFSEMADVIVLTVTESAPPSDTEWDRLCELPKAVSNILPARNFSVARMSTSGSVKTLFGSRYLDEEQFGVDLDPTGVSVPDNLVYAGIHCQSFNKTSSSNSYVFVELVQRIRFFEPRPVPLSVIPSS